ncbi:hypothetical protein DLREEDagrD3_08730 [Denitratisoma sp. agr-D3]
MIEKPFSTLEDWVQFYCDADVPVLRHTMQELTQLRENAENVNGRALASIVLKDPLMTMRVLRYIESHRQARQLTDITTIERAIMMIGITPFFRDFAELPLVETQLAAYPQSLLGLLKVINRSRKAAHWAKEWAILRHDLDVDEITVATLLRNGAEILMWCFAPTLALKVKALQTTDKSIRSSVAQRQIYGVTLNELGLALARDWHLPELITSLLDTSQMRNPRVRNVLLATDLARHSALDSDHPEIAEDIQAISELLHLNVETIQRKLGLDENNRPLPPPPKREST